MREDINCFTPNFRISRFRVSGRECHVFWTCNVGAITGTVSSVTFSLPINDVSETSPGFDLAILGYSQALNNYLKATSTDGTTIQVNPPTGNWTVSGTYYFGLHFIYEI